MPRVSLKGCRRRPPVYPRFNGETIVPPTSTQPSSDLSPSAVNSNPSAWGAFTRLFQQLDTRLEASDQIKRTLEAIREASGADVVYWHDEVTGETLSTTRRHSLSPEQCTAVVKRLVTKRSTEKSSIIWHSPSKATGAPHGLPHSAAAVRLHRSRPGWIMAMSSSRGRPLDRSVVRLIGLACAMLLKQWKHSRICAESKESLLGLVHCLAAVIDAKDAYTAGHSERVSRIAVRIARRMDLPVEAISDVHLAGLLHDVGKVGIRDDLLLKPGKLTAEERKHLRTHVLISDQIISTIKAFARLRPAVRGHHERYDGKGYPDGIAGEQIPLLGRILAVADACDAMMSARRYRDAMSPPQIDAVLLDKSGTQWDPKVVEAFMACRQAIYPPIYQKGIGESAARAIDRIVDGLEDASSVPFLWAG
jgi:HD-GYP domain-containing protein (c-di-GMP phosphodiesterase class II)